MDKRTIDRIIQEKFGDSIGSYAGDAPVGVRDERDEDDTITESRDRVGSREIMTTWEDLYRESGEVALETLVSWLGTTEDAVVQNMPRGLVVDENDFVIEDGGGFMGEGKKKGPSKKQAKGFIKGTKKFIDKVAKAKKAGMKNPEGFAATMQHAATGKWPGEK